MISNKQLEANRQNAKLGGVKTKAGKSISKLNALKHGLLSKEVLLAKESKEELLELGRRIRSEIKPQTKIEEVLTDRIIANMWRLKRALRIEREMIIEDYQEEDWEGEIKHSSLGGIFSDDFTNRDTYGKLIRYETSIEKGLFKALHELQRIQSAQAGEKPLAPVAIDVDITSDK